MIEDGVDGTPQSHAHAAFAGFGASFIRNGIPFRGSPASRRRNQLGQNESPFVSRLPRSLRRCVCHASEGALTMTAGRLNLSRSSNTLLVASACFATAVASHVAVARPSVGVAGPANQGVPLPQQAGDARDGQDVFRFETFGNEGFWTDAVGLPAGIAAAEVLFFDIRKRCRPRSGKRPFRRRSTMPPTRPRSSATGWSSGHGGMSTSRRPAPHRSTRLNASSRSSPNARSDAASTAASTPSITPSRPSLKSTTPTPSHSGGQNRRTISSLQSSGSASETTQ